ncbi:Protease 1 precursor [Porphyromonas crevioricanis]|uniref:Protease 1 n=2 Tax=Porphyromonas crevioricanis TaxID=393921 RepID=A0A2X4SVZ5_9PORP|nr:lysyl endopeptidase [Porphyromonas crevioricanis JCM 13913]SQH73921.1 Protease 1 precursor [Porphyromonas crevioricanis]
MKKLPISLLYLGIIFLYSLCMVPMQTQAQVSLGGTPKSFVMQRIASAGFSNSGEAQVRLLPLNKNIEDLIEQGSWDGENISARPYVIGDCVRTDIDMASQAEQFRLEDGTLVYRLKMKSPEAKAVYPTYSRFLIPKGAKLYVYNPDKSVLHGAYTHESNPLGGSFASMPVSGEDIILEYESNERGDAPEIIVDGLVHIFREQVAKMMDVNPGEDTSEYPTCMINANCPEGDDWRDQKAGIVQIFIVYDNGSTTSCSGALVNNTNQDFTPYILTASHCAGSGSHFPVSQESLNKWIFTFHYVKPDCSNASSATSYGKSMVGCSKVAYLPSVGHSDGLLLKLNQDIPLDYRVYYNGWDRRRTPPAKGVSLHHPMADAMKISIFSQRPNITYFRDFFGDGASKAHFEVTFNTGTEGGSSGSSLFNEKKLIVGTLTGGGEPCKNPARQDYYGRLHAHWDWFKEEGNDVQMATFLDPKENGKTEMLEGTYRENKQYYEPVARVMAIPSDNKGNRVKVIWTAPVGMDKKTVAEYQIKRNGQNLNIKVPHVHGTEYYQFEDQFNANDVINGMTDYQVRALYKEGDSPVETAWSPIVAAYTLADRKVAGVKVSKEGDKVHLSWNKPILCAEWSKIGSGNDIEFKPLPVEYRPQGTHDTWPLTQLTYRESWPFKGMPFRAVGNHNQLYVNQVSMLPTKAGTNIYAYLSAYDPAYEEGYKPTIIKTRVPNDWQPGQWVPIILPEPFVVDPLGTFFVGFVTDNELPTPAGIAYAEGSRDEYATSESALFWNPDTNDKGKGFYSLEHSKVKTFGKNYMAIRLLITNSSKKLQQPITDVAAGSKGLAVLPIIKGYQIRRNGEVVAEVKELTYTSDIAAKEEDKYEVFAIYETDPAVYLNQAQAQNTFVVSGICQGEGSLEITGFENLNEVPYGTTLSVKAQPNKSKGYTLESIKAGNEDITRKKSFVVKSDVVVKAIFVQKGHQVKLRSNALGKIEIAGYTNDQLKSVPTGTELTVLAKPQADNIKLSKLTANGEDIMQSMKFVVTTDTEIIAEFAKTEGINDVRKTGIQLYPNPADDYVEISGADKNAELLLMELNGQVLLRSMTDANGAARIDLTQFAPGSYLLQVGKLSHKLVVQ